MAKLSPDELDSIIRRDLPGYHISSRSSMSKSAPFDFDSGRSYSVSAAPGLDSARDESLKNKYLGDDAVDDESPDGLDQPASAGDADDDTDDADEMIVAVEPDHSAHPWDRSARPKAAVVSVKDKKIIGQQG